MKKLTLEYPINSSIRILFPRLSTAMGLSEWFADEVTVEKDHTFIFRWKKHKQRARRIKFKDQQNVSFKWIDDGHNDEEHSFEFIVTQDELTGEVLLTIIDFTEPDEIEDTKKLWEAQITNLKRLLGS